MEPVPEYLRGPPNEGGFYVSLAFCAADRRLKTKPRTLTVTINGLYQARPGVPEATRAPKSNIF